MSVLAIVLIAVGVLILLVLVGGILGTRRRARAEEGSFEDSLAAADRVEPVIDDGAFHGLDHHQHRFRSTPASAMAPSPLALAALRTQGIDQGLRTAERRERFTRSGGKAYPGSAPDDENDEKTPADQLVDQLVDAFVYAPLGLALTVRESWPALVEKGRERFTTQAAVARINLDGAPDAALLEEIRRIHQETKEAYGATKTWRALNQSGRMCGKHRVARLRRQAGIEARRKRKFRLAYKARNTAPPPANLLRWPFKADHPDQIWVTDVTFIPTRSG